MFLFEYTQGNLYTVPFSCCRVWLLWPSSRTAEVYCMIWKAPVSLVNGTYSFYIGKVYVELFWFLSVIIILIVLLDGVGCIMFPTSNATKCILTRPEETWRRGWWNINTEQWNHGTHVATEKWHWLGLNQSDVQWAILVEKEGPRGNTYSANSGLPLNFAWVPLINKQW